MYFIVPAKTEITQQSMNVTANFVTDDIFNQYTALIVSVESICTKDNKTVFAQKVELNHSDANQLQV